MMSFWASCYVDWLHALKNPVGLTLFDVVCLFVWSLIWLGHVRTPEPLRSSLRSKTWDCETVLSTLSNLSNRPGSGCVDGKWQDQVLIDWLIDWLVGWLIDLIDGLMDWCKEYGKWEVHQFLYMCESIVALVSKPTVLFRIDVLFITACCPRQNWKGQSHKEASSTETGSGIWRPSMSHETDRPVDCTSTM